MSGWTARAVAYQSQIEAPVEEENPYAPTLYSVVVVTDESAHGLIEDRPSSSLIGVFSSWTAATKYVEDHVVGGDTSRLRPIADDDEIKVGAVLVLVAPEGTPADADPTDDWDAILISCDLIDLPAFARVIASVEAGEAKA